MGLSITAEDMWTEFVATKNSALREELIKQYGPLVRYVVGRMGIPPTSMLELEDLVSYGMIGLINAVDRFDPARGVRFESFATTRIRGSVIDQLRTLNWLPRSAMARIKQIEGALAILEQRLGRPATEEEAAIEVGVSIQRYRQMLREVGVTILSLDAPLKHVNQDDDANSLTDLLEDQSTPSPADQVEHQEDRLLLAAALDRLPERERILLSLYYHEELTMKEISTVMGISESRVCQLHMQAVMRLRAVMSVQGVEEARSSSSKLKAVVGGSRRS
ncbi:MAG: FliA/WhiG family RNA polymerase sigma factor [Ktedonobacteraceae bacterium]|nr:FliA/WhiG family RNA polymerase sigma factor [Ktedonobacteraceae bacterium]